MRQQELAANKRQLAGLRPLRFLIPQPTQPDTVIANLILLDLISNAWTLDDSPIGHFYWRPMRVLDELTQAFQKRNHSRVELAVEEAT
jgi:hypothetical protein